jgi:hypothetical protein
MAQNLVFTPLHPELEASVAVAPTPPPAGPVTRTWVGSGKNIIASDPGNWSPNGAPKPNEQLVMPKGRMSIVGNDLAGDMLQIGIANQRSEITLDLSGHAAADIYGPSNVKVALNLNIAGATQPLWLREADSTLNIHIAPLAKLNVDTFFLINDVTHIDGHGLVNNGHIVLGGGMAFIRDNVEGSGEILMRSWNGTPPSVELGHGVVNTQFIDVGSGTLQVDSPQELAGSVSLLHGIIELIGLAKADSYTFKNDMLSIWSGNNIIDTVRLVTPGAAVFPRLSVIQTSMGVVLDRTGTVAGAIIPEQA